MAKTPQQANAKWVASTSQGEQAWVDGLNQTTKPIVQKALENRSAMQANFNAATAQGGVWEQKLSAVGDAGIKKAATDRRANYSTGVQQGASKQLAAITKIIAYEQQGLTAIEQMPSATPAQRKARMTAWFDYMSAGRGQLGA